MSYRKCVDGSPTQYNSGDSNAWLSVRSFLMYKYIWIFFRNCLRYPPNCPEDQCKCYTADSPARVGIYLSIYLTVQKISINVIQLTVLPGYVSIYISTYLSIYIYICIYTFTYLRMYVHISINLLTFLWDL